VNLSMRREINVCPGPIETITPILQNGGLCWRVSINPDLLARPFDLFSYIPLKRTSKVAPETRFEIVIRIRCVLSHHLGFAMNASLSS